MPIEFCLILQRTTVLQLKGMVKEKTGLEEHHQKLIYLSKYIQDCKTLGDYGLQSGSNIFLVMRLLGGSGEFRQPRGSEGIRLEPRGSERFRQPRGSGGFRQTLWNDPIIIPRRQEDCVSEGFRQLGGTGGFNRTPWIDPTIPRSLEECMITRENTKENGIVVLKMPCRHSISPDGLMDYAWAEVSIHKKTEIKCPLCTTEWMFSTIRRYGGATSTDLGLLEVGISNNFCMHSSDINQCPKCQSYITRQNTSINSVYCIRCLQKGYSSTYFCWYCLQDWKTPLHSTHCGNANCCDAEKLAKLQDCKTVVVQYTNLQVPELRACPACGSIIQLDGGCKHMTCRACVTEFCFVCLRIKTNGSWLCGSYNTVCSEAPRQTVIPKP